MNSFYICHIFVIQCLTLCLFLISLLLFRWGLKNIVCYDGSGRRGRNLCERKSRRCLGSVRRSLAACRSSRAGWWRPLAQVHKPTKDIFFWVGKDEAKNWIELNLIRMAGDVQYDSQNLEQVPILYNPVISSCILTLSPLIVSLGVRKIFQKQTGTVQMTCFSAFVLF